MLRLRNYIEDLQSTARAVGLITISDRAYHSVCNDGQAGFCYLRQACSIDVNLREPAREKSAACLTASALDCCQSIIDQVIQC